MSQPSAERHEHERWSSSGAFLLAAVGGAVGLGNIWRFPYIAGENGGGAFVLIYLGCIIFIGVPLMMAELLMGRRGGQSPVTTMGILAREAGQSQAWRLVGWLGVITPLLAITFYGVVAGWGIAYVLKTASGLFTGAGLRRRGRALPSIASRHS